MKTLRNIYVLVLFSFIGNQVGYTIYSWYLGNLYSELDLTSYYSWFFLPILLLLIYAIIALLKLVLGDSLLILDKYFPTSVRILFVLLSFLLGIMGYVFILAMFLILSLF